MMAIKGSKYKVRSRLLSMAVSAAMTLAACGGGGGGSGTGAVAANGTSTGSQTGAGSGGSSGGAGSGSGTSAQQGCAAYSAPSDQQMCFINSVAAPYTLALRIASANSQGNQPIVQMPTDGTAAKLSIFAVGTSTFVPTSFSWAQVQPGIDNFASIGSATLSAQTTSAPSIMVSLPKSGTYQFKVIASSADKHVVTNYVWVNAWDSTPALSPTNIGRAPGLLPPPSVQLLSADPGPFSHPRLLFSAGDWSQLSAKSTGAGNVPESVAAVQVLTASLANNFDKSGTAMNNLVIALQKYVSDDYAAADYAAISTANGFTATNVPVLFKASAMGHNTDTEFSDALAAASYLAWLAVDPSKTFDPTTAAGQRLVKLATLTAAWSNYLLQAELQFPTAYTGTSSGALANYSLAISYDLTYAAMSDDQRTSSRSYLYTIGNLYNQEKGGIGTLKPATNFSSLNQNGVDFPNLQDGIIYPALVIEGEEGQVNSSILSNPAFGAYASASTSSDPAVTAITSWPNANQISVRNLGRQVRANSEYILSPWGFYHTMTAYFNLGQNVASPATLALARRGENQWVTTNLYQAMLHTLYNLMPTQTGGTMYVLDHHDGSGFAGGDAERNFYFIAKYMFPDDPMIDFVYRQATNGYTGNALTKAIFGAPLLANTLNQVGTAKELALMKFDPFMGFAISRNSWDANDLNLVMNNFTLGGGHYHAEANSFSLSALGRVWANPPGYHVVPADAQQQVLIQMHPGATDASGGYIGQGPGSYDLALNNGSAGSPFHGVLLDVIEDPSHQYSWFAGDAAPAYNFVSGGSGAAVSTGLTNAYMLLPGLANALTSADAAQLTSSAQFGNANAYNSVKYAFRSILTVRGTTPYVIVIDDIEKDGSTHNYRWTMNDSVDFGPSEGVFVDINKNSVYSSLEISSGATATDAILYHDIDAGNNTGLPRMLVRDVSEQSTTGQPAIVIDDRPIIGTPTVSTNLTYGVDNNTHQFTYFPSRRLFIDRRNVVEPDYKVLLFPYMTGGTLPITSWDATKTKLTVQYGSTTDVITFDRTNADRRTRLVSLVRTTS